MSTSVTTQTIVNSYRTLYRASLRAVQYSTPNRYLLRDRLRRAFRESPRADYEPDRIANTLSFLNAAASDTGLEHRVVKSLCHVWHGEHRQWKARSRTWTMIHSQKAKRPQVKWETQAYDNFYWTVRMLNESMGLCIK
ncbi:DUF1763-domain-containing protein [Microthyrium microscopicum]|uniref:DUF1763-domain-containing protein n=1 Tax=Microthyrium microscopicum TaxID=703497 RepID=A0A6A6UHV1_9PEZI|nr:DUF1763-domain-containing protein [Microthyrium microscopicum]